MPISAGRIGLDVAGRSFAGRRHSNEDAFLVHHFRSPLPGALTAVADGISGQIGGGIASGIVKDRISSWCRAVDDLNSRLDDAEFLLALASAEKEIRRWSHGQRIRTRAGTTLSAVLFGADGARIFHIGDSRVYRLRSGRPELLTRDDTVAQDLVDGGVIAADEYPRSPLRRRLTRYVGKSIEGVLSRHVEVFPDDVFILCTDGCLDSTTDRPDLSVDPNERRPEVLLDRLFDRIEQRGNDDDATAIVVVVK